MRRISKLSAVLLMTTALTGAAMAEGTTAITEIELGQAGIARYTMQAEVTGPRLTFTVPEKAASDVLASLVVRDPAGAVIGLQTATPGSAPGPFDTVPRTTQQLLAALVGESVTLTTGQGAVTGRVLGLGEARIVTDGEAMSRTTALLLGERGVTEIVLTPGMKVDISADAAEGLAAALSEKTTPRDMRAFDLTLAAETDRAVDLSYVTEAPAWKNSWRLLLDEGRLQGWATFENVSGTDWEDVDLTLTTGEPVAYRRALIDPLYRPRLGDPDAPAPVQHGTVGIKARAAPAMLSVASGGGLSSVSAQPGRQVLSSGILRYALPEAIDLADGRTANRLYLDLPIEPDILGLYRQNKPRDGVVLAVALTADQPLASGLISVQDEAGFVGDAPFGGMQSGDTQLLSYAQATGSEVNRTQDQTLQVVAATRGDGVLNLRLRATFTTTYATTTLPDDVDRFVVEHREERGKVIDHSGDMTRRGDVYRVSVPVEDGAASLRIVEQKSFSDKMRPGGSDLAEIEAHIQDGTITMEPDLRRAIEQGVKLDARLDASEEERERVQALYEELVAEQARLRENLETVAQEALRARYLDALDRTETRIGDTFDRLDGIRRMQEEISAELLALFDDL